MMDPVIDEQASRAGIDDVTPGTPPQRRSWREDEHLVLERDNQGAIESEPTGMAGGGMPEAAGQAEDPGTDTDISLPSEKERINLDRV
jgi:hypothetical protein